MSDPPRHESGLPSYEGYTSPPPPGAGGVAAAVSEPSAGRYVLAGWWSRVAAALIDGAIVGAGAFLVLALFGSLFGLGFLDGEDSGTGAVIVGLVIVVLAVAVISLLYAPFLMARTDGKTFGRMAVGNRVVRANGKPITFGFALLREVVVKALLFGFLATLTFGVASLLDVLWPLWDDEDRALHDFVVDTRTVKD